MVKPADVTSEICPIKSVSFDCICLRRFVFFGHGEHVIAAKKKLLVTLSTVRCQSIFSEPRRVRRHVDGVSPTMRRKERAKCCRSHMPQVTAIELSGSDVVSINTWATSMRRRKTYSRGETPNVHLNARQK